MKIYLIVMWRRSDEKEFFHGSYNPSDYIDQFDGRCNLLNSRPAPKLMFDPEEARGHLQKLQGIFYNWNIEIKYLDLHDFSSQPDLM